DAEFAAEPVQVGPHALWRGGLRFGQDRDFLARYRLQRLTNVSVAAVGIRRIPEGDALIVRRAEQLRDPVVAQLARLIRTAVRPYGSGAHGHAADLDLSRPKKHAIRRVLRLIRGEEMVGEIGQ